MPETLYLATGACAGCPYRQHCHAARQRAMDHAGIGRHTTCPYYATFARRGIVRQEPRFSITRGIVDLLARGLGRAADALRRRAR